jgi:hypothetical protein
VRLRQTIALALLAGLAMIGAAQTSTSAPISNVSLGDLGALNGWVPSPNDAWHQDITNVAIDPTSATIMNTSGDLASRYLHPDFGTYYGIPYTVVDSSITPLVPVTPLVYVGDSDITIYPITPTTPIEGFPGLCPTDGSDRHAIVLDRNTGVDYELYQASYCNSQWTASNTAIWDFTETEHRPYTLTSTDAAGLSVFEGLIRYDEIIAGSINHAIRFTANHTKNDANNGYFTAPATHAAGSNWGTDNIIGMRIRLRANFDISGFSATNQIILKAMKQYGMILADNGSDMYFQGTPDSRWDENDLDALKTVPSSAFDVVQMAPIYDSATAPTGPAPQITSFTASQSNVVSGTPVVLTPVVTGASYSYIDVAGFVRGPITVTPLATTTYTLTSRNAYGTTTASTTVVVQASKTPTLAFASIADQTYGTAPFTVLAISNSPGAITYSVISGPASISGSTITLTGAGTVTLQAEQASNGSYVAATTRTSFNVNGAIPSLAFVTIPDQTYGAAPFTISATSNSSGVISYSVVSGPASVSGNTVTITKTGRVTLIASQVAIGNFASGTATISFNVIGATPTLTFAAIPNKTYGTAPFTISAASESSGVITYSVVSGPATISGNVLATNGIGIVTLQASQASAGNYTSAIATTSFNITGATPTLTFAAIPGVTYGASPFTVSATSNSSGAITYSVVSGPASISGNVLALNGVGTVMLQASQTAEGNYTSATATTSFNIAGATPTLAFSAIPSETYGASPFTVSATSNSSGSISYSVVNGPATISGNTVTLTGVGTVVLQANQAAYGDYTSATVTTSFSIPLSLPVASVGDFKLPTNVPAITIAPGQSGNLLIDVASIDGFSGTISFSCNVPTTMQATSCSATSAQLAVSATANSKITLTTSASPTLLSEGRGLVGGHTNGLVFLSLLAPFGIPWWRRRRAIWSRLALGLVFAMVLTGCGSGVYPHITPPGRYTVLVNATSGAISHTMNLTVIVQ